MIAEGTGMNELLDVADVARLLKCSNLTVYRRCRSECFPYMRNGRRMLFKRSDISSWLEGLRENSMHGVQKVRG